MYMQSRQNCEEVGVNILYTFHICVYTYMYMHMIYILTAFPNDIYLQLQQRGGNIAIMGTSSGTDSSEDGKLSATVNISQNLNNGSNFSFVPSGSAFSAGLNESAVIQIVKDALMKYDADKTGMVDHALETAGGNIISTRCTESYQVRHVKCSSALLCIYDYFLFLLHFTFIHFIFSLFISLNFSSVSGTSG